MRNSLRVVMHPVNAKSVAFAMTFALLFSSLLAPLMPIVDAATLENSSSAEAAALANNQTVPLDPEEGTSPPDNQGEQVPPDGEGDSSPVDEEAKEPPVNEGEEQPENGTGEQPPPDSPAHWLIYLHWCPPGVDMAAAPAQRGELERQCIRRGPLVQATITPVAGGSPVLQQTIRDFDNFIGFQEMPGDWLFNIQSVPNIAERFDCEGRSPAGVTKPYATYARSAGGFQVSTVSGEHLECWWFGQMQNTSVLQVVKYNCPAGFDFASSSS